jgi:hypothetical protein
MNTACNSLRDGTKDEISYSWIGELEPIQLTTEYEVYIVGNCYLLSLRISFEEGNILMKTAVNAA